ncbi:MAG: hypothetical protein CM1200mP37_1000 [Chloroflexota bacterium]|nr:MAG: hypothetical protein CM1200mP37_1000 [Chloroflexota bacterium]
MNQSDSINNIPKVYVPDQTKKKYICFLEKWRIF